MNRNKQLQELRWMFWRHSTFAKLMFVACLTFEAGTHGPWHGVWGAAVGLLAYLAGRSDAHLWILERTK